jgi:hypothetical protein
MNRSSLNALVIAGLLVCLLGVAGFAIPVFTTHETHEVARIGDLSFKAGEEKSYVVPPLVSGTAVVLGAILMIVGFLRRP